MRSLPANSWINEEKVRIPNIEVRPEKGGFVEDFQILPY
jgi:hypothetical protein